MELFDVAVVGGGLAGASLACALAGTERSTILIEGVAPGSLSQPSFDERTTALGNASRRIFQGLGVWDAIEPSAAAIRAIHVSDAGRFGFARLEARDHGIEAFGYVAPNRVIGAALWERIAAAAPRVALRVPARVESAAIEPDRIALTLLRGGAVEHVAARLVVAADGADSIIRQAVGIEVRTRDYGQVAIVARVAADRPHEGTAFERFTPAGPIALLPNRDGSFTAVWACPPPQADAALALGERAFLEELQSHFGWRAGRFLRGGARARYPLRLTQAAAAVRSRAVLIGNAAQALHPVAGQGFNLGLRDAAQLAEILADADDPGAPRVLARFAEERAADRRGVVGFTDGLVRLFGDARPPIRLARNVGLLIFDQLPPLKSALARVSTGFAGRIPRLARGLPLT